MLPNIPLIIGFTNSVTNAAAAAIPNYTDPQLSFGNNVDRTINGYLLQANAWTPIERSALMTPGLLYPVETGIQMNTHFNIYGKRLDLPIITAQTPIVTARQFASMQTSNSWFRNILPMMETYCSFFNGSTTLQQCTIATSAAPLIISEHSSLSSPIATNNFGHSTHAFPSDTPLSFEARHSSTETELPPAATMLAQDSQLNVRTNVTDELGICNDIGHINTTSSGPYWDKLPVFKRSVTESCSEPSAPSFRRITS